MKKLPKWLTAFAAIALIGATPATADHHENAEEAADPWTGYSAHGTEPFWSLSITENRLSIEHAGDFSAEAERRDRNSAWPGMVFISQSENPGGRDFIVLIDEIICNDGMADMVWPHSVRVIVDGRLYRGCGGDSASVLAGEEWRVTTIAGEEVPATVGQTLQFDMEGGVSGNGGCNRFMGSYDLTGGISFGPIASTRRACINPDISQFESALLGALGTVYGLGVSEDGVLTLLGPDGPAITARR